VLSSITIARKNGPESPVDISSNISQTTALYGDSALNGWFSVGYGPFRRLRGGDGRFVDLFVRRPRLAAHLSSFLEEVDLHHVVGWLKDRALDARKKNKDEYIVNGFKHFINESGMLPHGSKLHEINSEGIIIKDANGASLSIYEMSDGYRSALGMTLDLLRYLVVIYGEKKVFKKDKIEIDLPGVVIIDEIDSHLHPTWQARIGEWFLKYFPKMQFIVTTHSPIICWAAKKGSIHYLHSPGSPSPRFEKLEKSTLDKLLYGNIFEAYSTGVFGEDGRPEAGEKLLLTLGHLTQRKMYGVKMTSDELAEYDRLTKIFQTDAIPNI
jgi:predicted ATP-binding protein involved in virulence